MNEVTIGCLIYRSVRWLEWVVDQLASARNQTTAHILVVANDANLAVMRRLERGFDRPEFASFRWVDHRNENPHEYHMARVYRAWNRTVHESATEDVVLVNSDMSFGDGWLDELIGLRTERPDTLPNSLLVESGKLASGLPQYVRDFGRTPDQFDRAGFMRHAEMIRERSDPVFDGGLFMPVLWKKSQLAHLGGYPIQQPNHSLASDAVLFNAARDKLGLIHRTATRSVVYHAQLGETDDP